MNLSATARLLLVAFALCQDRHRGHELTNIHSRRVVGLLRRVLVRRTSTSARVCSFLTVASVVDGGGGGGGGCGCWCRHHD